MNINHKITYTQKVAAALDGVSIAVPKQDQLTAILAAALEAANPELAVKKNLRIVEDELIAGLHTYRLKGSTKIVTIALGKAAPAMLNGAIQQLGTRFNGGVCACKHLEAGYLKVPGINYVIGNHPVPGEGSLRAGEAISKAVEGLGSEDLVLLLVSGGGSALATLPVAVVSLADLQQLTGTLLRSGATIAELNTVRKHLDLIKGGGLVRLSAPARVAALVLSDVVGNNLEVIASGPATPDPSTYSDALKVVNKASVHGDIPANILHILEQGQSGNIPETLKSGEPAAQRGFNTIIASNLEACAAAAEKASALGFQTEIVTNQLIGEAREAGIEVVNLVKQQKERERPFVLIWGGETTVTVSGSGKGGRNQELALAAVRALAEIPDTLLVTLATDGEDGPTDAAGALVNGASFSRAIGLGMNPDVYLQNNDAYTFFNRLGDLLITGATGTNVNDLTFVFGY